MFLVIRNLAIQRVDADSGQVRHLVEQRVITLAELSVELQFGNVTTGIGRSDITHIAETTRAVDVGIRHLTNGTFLINDIQG